MRIIRTVIVSLSLLSLGLPIQSVSDEQPNQSQELFEIDKAMRSGDTENQRVVQVEKPQIGHFEPQEPIYRIPNTILQTIMAKMTEGGWEECDWGYGNQIKLFSTHFFNLENHKLLLLLGISDYFCGSNTFLPVTVDYQGNWDKGEFIEGKPTWLVKGSDQALWLNSQWQIEGTYPSLYRSTDGIQWQPVTLPENRNVDCCFEWLTQICFDKQQIQLKFEGDYTNKTEYWVGYRPDILKPMPKWHLLNHCDQNCEKNCSFVPVTQGNWIRIESEDTQEVRFQLQQNELLLTVIIPKRIPVK